MHKPTRILHKMSFLANAEFLVGCAFLLSGAILVWNGGHRLQQLYHQFAGYFPLRLPEDIAQTLLHSFPLIFKIFINSVGSICAVLMGALWFFGGIADMLEGRKKWSNAPDLERPEIVAESLRSAQSLYWQSMTVPIRILARLVPRARFISPITYEMIRHLFLSACKMILLGVFVALLFYLLGIVPTLVNKYLHWEMRLVIPSAEPLYSILTLLLIANGLMAASLLPFRKPEYSRTCETIPITGRGDPHFFFALLEEGCQLLGARGPALHSRCRLERSDDSAIKGTLIESHPKGMPSLARPAGYVCLPLIPLLLTAGFSRLSDFSPDLTPLYFTDFLSLQLSSYALDAALALALILSGVYFADWARKLLGVRRFQSAIVFCNIVTDKAAGPDSPSNSTHRESATSHVLKWRPSEGLDEDFARWAKNPRAEGNFLVEICWAEAVSESASEDGPRYLTDMRISEDLEDSMRRLIQLPFYVNLEPALSRGQALSCQSRSGPHESHKNQGEPIAGT